MTFAEAKKRADEAANTGTPMPMYKCHKEVSALQIGAVLAAPQPTIAELQRLLADEVQAKTDIGAILVPVLARFAPFPVSREFVAKHNPRPGGYYVVYKDGYTSFSPVQAFEEGYTLVK